MDFTIREGVKMSHKPEYNHGLSTTLSDIRCMTCLIILVMIVSGISLAFLLTY